MKKTNYFHPQGKRVGRVLKSLVIPVFLALFVLTASNLFAQSATNISNLNFVTKAQAIEILEAHYDVVKSDLAGLTEGTTQFNNVLAKAEYFERVKVDIQGNISIPNAIEQNALATFGSGNADKDVQITGQNRAQIHELMDECIELLTL